MRISWVSAGAAILIVSLACEQAVCPLFAADFDLTDRLGHTWTNECVTFHLTPAQQQQANLDRALVGPRNEEVVWQLTHDHSTGKKAICFQADLPPFSQQSYGFINNRRSLSTDLVVQDLPNEIRIANAHTGIAIRKIIKGNAGPVAGIRLKSGIWVGDSSLDSRNTIADYSVRLVASGPVFAELRCDVVFEDGAKWSLTFRLENDEPVVLIEEECDIPGEAGFQVSLNGSQFKPDQVLYRAGNPPHLGKVRSGELTTDGPVFELEPWLHWWLSERRGNWSAFYSHNSPDLLMVAAPKPGRWVDPHWKGKAQQQEPLATITKSKETLTLQLSLGGGRRSWLLGSPDKQRSLELLSEKNSNNSPLPQHYLIKHGDFPLNEIKDYVLEWPEQNVHHPRLFLDQDDVAKLRETLKSDPTQLRRWETQQPIDRYDIDGPLREYFATHSETLAQKIIVTCENWLTTVVREELLLQNGRSTLGVAPHSQAVLLLPTLNLIDTALGCPELSDELRRQFKAKLAFLGYVVNRADYWSPERGFAANPNMTTTVAQYQVAIACLLPSHPEARKWADRGLDELHTQLMNWSDGGGGWREAPHYAMVSYDHMIAAFIMAAKSGFADYLFEERVRKVTEWFAKISTPRDATTGGFRHLPPVGNTYYGEATGVFGIVAGLWKERDPKFAAEMQWMYEEHGRAGLGLGWSFPSMAGYKELLKSHEIAPRAPDYGSCWFRQTGVVFRDNFNTDRESWLYLIAGANHDHYDFDSGSIVLWGNGQKLIDDWGYIGRHGEQFHSMLTADEISPDATMQIEAFSTQPELDYVSGRKGSWQRQICFAKSVSSADSGCYLLSDHFNGSGSATWRLWLNTSDVVRDGNHFSVRAEGGVHFDIFLEDADPLSVQTEEATQRVSVGNQHGKIGPLTLTRTAVVAKLRGPGVIRALIVPRMTTERRPQVVWHAGGNIVEVVSADSRKVLFLRFDSSSKANGEVFQLEAEPVSFSGSAGLIRQTKGKSSMTLGAAGTIEWNKRSLTADEATSRSVPD